MSGLLRYKEIKMEIKFGNHTIGPNHPTYFNE